MDDKTLLKISLLVSVFGLLVLYVFSINLEVRDMRLAEEEGNVVKVTGHVKNVKNFGNVTLINLKTEQAIKIVVFERIEVPKEKVEVIGEVKRYKGENEIIADSINVVE